MPLTQDEEIKRDAARWRALMSSERLHFMGSSGISHTRDGNGPVCRPSEVWHFGMEFLVEAPTYPGLS